KVGTAAPTPTAPGDNTMVVNYDQDFAFTNIDALMLYTDTAGTRTLFVGNRDSAIASNNRVLRFNVANERYLENTVPVKEDLTNNAGNLMSTRQVLVNPSDGTMYVASLDRDQVLHYFGPRATNNPAPGNNPDFSAEFFIPGGGSLPPITLFLNQLD